MKSIARVCLCLWLGLVVAVPGLAQNDQDREGGIIGTGIVGIVTQLGSIWVNDQHIRFDPDLPVRDGISVKTAADIRPGHTVAVVATPDGEDWRARDIRQVLPLVGPVSAVEGAQLQILGTIVHAKGPVVGVSPGDWIVVSGLWREGEVEASRLERLPKDWSRAQITGTYLGADDPEGLWIGGTRVTGIAPKHLQPGDVIRAFGTVGPDGLRADRLEKSLFSEPVQLVQAEGYVSPPRPDGLYTVLGSGLLSYTERSDQMDTAVRMLTCGTEGPMVAGTKPDDVQGALYDLSLRLGCPVR